MAPRCRPGSRPDDYLGDVTARSGIAGLEALDDVTIVAVPDLVAAYEAGQIDADGFKAVQSALITHCETQKDRVAILDTPRGLNAQQVLEWVKEKTQFSSAYATMYWPWLSFWDPLAGRPGCSRRAARSPASGVATTTPAACTRRRPTRSSPVRWTSSSTSRASSTTTSTRRAST